MAQSLIPEEITEVDLARCRNGLVMNNLGKEITEREIKKVLKAYLGHDKFNISLGKIIMNSNDPEVRRAFLNFHNANDLNILMKNRSLITIHGKSIEIVRNIPNKFQHHGHPMRILSVTMYQSASEGMNRSELNEVDLKKYFDKFGTIIDCQWKENENTKKAYLEFEDYDSVDRVMLYTVSHKIKKIPVKVQKEIQAPQRRDQNDSNNASRPYSIFVKNLPPRITSEELSLIFDVYVADILLRPQPILEENEIGDILPWKAWIKHSSKYQIMEKLVKKMSDYQLHGYKIQCECIQDEVHPTQLCDQFEIGQCQFSNTSCDFKHWMCNEPDACENKNCWFGHTDRRLAKSNCRPKRERDSTYRIKMCNLPAHVTEEQLMKRLGIQDKWKYKIKLAPEPCENGTKTAYYAHLVSENYSRRLIRQWHNKHFSDQFSPLIKCQLEYNVDMFDWNYLPADVVLRKDALRSFPSTPVTKLKSTTPEYDPQETQQPTNVPNSSLSITTQPQTWANHCKPSCEKPNKQSVTPTLPSVSIANSSMPSDMAKHAPDWRWTNEKTFENSLEKIEEYTVVSKNDENRQATMRIFLPDDDNENVHWRVCHELTILKRLQDLAAVPKLIATNINLSNNPNKFWIIIENIRGITLKEFLDEHRELKISDAIILSRKLLFTIKQFHLCNIIHRNLEPQNILVKNFQNFKNSSTKFNKIQFVIINFNAAVINDSSIPFGKQDYLAFVEQQDHNQFEDIFLATNTVRINNTFYRVPQLVAQSMEELLTDEQQQIVEELRSPTIDISHVCAILFWLITIRAPRAARDINDHAPHELHENSKLIEKKLRESTGIWTRQELFDHLKKHLTLIFDRGFAKFNRQWSFDELEFQFKFIIELIANDGQKDTSAYWPKSADIVPVVSFNLNDRFLRAATLIDHVKQYIVSRCTNSIIHWATEKKSQWSGNSEFLKNYDEITMEWPTEHKNIIKTTWYISSTSKDDLCINVLAEIHEKPPIELPLGTWEIGQVNVIERIGKSLEMKLKVLMKILSANENSKS